MLLCYVLLWGWRCLFDARLECSVTENPSSWSPYGTARFDGAALLPVLRFQTPTTLLVFVDSADYMATGVGVVCNISHMPLFASATHALAHRVSFVLVFISGRLTRWCCLRHNVTCPCFVGSFVFGGSMVTCFVHVVIPGLGHPAFPSAPTHCTMLVSA